MTILGLGRMGGAMATTLHEHSWHVTAWNRSETEVPEGIDLAADAASAVAGADVVVLSLFAFDACWEVVERCSENVSEGALFVNTSTVGPEEATALARQAQDAGARYVHAPVLGSVPAVRAGRLQVLAGGEADDVDEARGVLDVVAAEVRHVGDPARAAALKLVANASLAGALVALRDVIEAARALDIDIVSALDVLAGGQLGGLSEAKRVRLTGDGRVAPADFTIGALLKDMRLLSHATGLDTRVHREMARLVAEGRVGVSDDVGAVFLPVSSLAGATS